MDDYIRREEVAEYLMGRIKNYLEMGDRIAIIPLNFAMAHIKSLPAADVEPVKRAWWIDEEGIIVCSNCGASMEVTDSFGEENHRDYCPNCGAKMDGGVYYDTDGNV